MGGGGGTYLADAGWLLVHCFGYPGAFADCLCRLLTTPPEVHSNAPAALQRNTSNSAGPCTTTTEINSIRAKSVTTLRLQAQHALQLAHRPDETALTVPIECVQSGLRAERSHANLPERQLTCSDNYKQL